MCIIVVLKLSAGLDGFSVLICTAVTTTTTLTVMKYRTGHLHGNCIFVLTMGVMICSVKQYFAELKVVQQESKYCCQSSNSTKLCECLGVPSDLLPSRSEPEDRHD